MSPVVSLLSDSTRLSFFKAAEGGDEVRVREIIYQLPIQDRSTIWESRKPGSHAKSDTVIHVVVRKGYFRLLHLAISCGASLTVINQHNKQPLHEAAQVGSSICAKAILSLPSVPVDPLKRADWTPLMLACAAGSHDLASSPSEELGHFTECVKLLLAHGALTTFTNKDGWNCLHLAVRAQCKDIAQILLQHTPLLASALTNNGRNCLHCCASSVSDVDGNHLGEEWCCIEHQLIALDPSMLLVADNCGTIPLFDALRRGHVRRAALFLQRASAAEQQLAHRDKLGQQAVHVAAEARQLESLKLIVIRLNLDALNAVTTATLPGLVHGVTALHLACRSGCCPIVDYIIRVSCEQGLSNETASILCPLDSRNHSPLWYAAVGLPGSGLVNINERISCMEALCVALLRHSQTVLPSALDVPLVQLKSLLFVTTNDRMVQFLTGQIATFSTM